MKHARPQANAAGLIPVIKPKGMTSSQAVQRVKRSLDLSRAGHSGTLDPMATGILIILANGATRMVPLMERWEKEYVALARLGIVTDTDDMEGKVIGSSECGPFEEEMVRDALLNFKGELLQTPPLYSAKKYKGRPHYEYARKGLMVERKASRVSVKKIELMRYDHPFVRFSVCCSKGTYIRSICRDFGKFLGCGAAMAELERTRNGPFDIEDAFELSEIEGGNGRFILSIEPRHFDLRTLVLSCSAKSIAESGGMVYRKDIPRSWEITLEKGKDYLALDGSGNALGIFECIKDETPDKVEERALFRAKRIFL